MCGIIGYLNCENATERALKGLRAFEARGYDSTGIGFARASEDAFTVVKSTGTVDKLRAKLGPVPGADVRTVIGHTRWATHGAKTEANAHPHVSASGQVMLVHNGTIHNDRELRARLVDRGYPFSSETDSEVIANLIDEALQSGANASRMDAVLKALRQLDGTWALVIRFLHEPDALYVAAKGSSLVIGYGEGEREGEMFVASEPTALFSDTSLFLRVLDGECARVRPDGLYQLVNLSGEIWNRPAQRIEPRVRETTDRPEGMHSMLYEIHEIPKRLASFLEGIDGQLDGPSGQAFLGRLDPTHGLPVRRVVLTGCGSAFHACLYAEWIWPESVQATAVACLASGGRIKRLRLDGEQDVAIAVSNSGTTYDTLQAVRHALAREVTVFCVVNDAHVTLDYLSHGALYTEAGIEDGVAATKTFVSQCAAFAALVIRLTGSDPSEQAALQALPAQIGMLITDAEARIRDEVAPRLAEAEAVFVLGQEAMGVIALEGALKLQEVAKSRAFAKEHGELKHGPLALVDETVVTVMLMSDDADLLQGARLTLGEIRNCKHGPIIVIVSERSVASVPEFVDMVITVPDTIPMLLPILHAVVLQLAAYYAALIKGLNPDRPDHLAKTITVA